VRRCEEMERKLRYLENEIAKDVDVKLTPSEENCEAPKPKEMIDLEVIYFKFYLKFTYTLCKKNFAIRLY